MTRWSSGAAVAARNGRVAALILSALGVMAAVAALPRLAQDPGYHAFADRRPIGPLPNALDVLSNLAFVVAGGAGLLAVRAARGRFADPREARPWALFFAAVALVGPGSAWYHLAPSDASLVWDRLPMAVAFAALLVAALAERIDGAAAALLAPLALASAGTVAWWAISEAAGAGDLRPYVFAQFYPMLALPLVMALFPERYTRAGGWLAGLAGYALAKVAEAADGPVLAALHAVGGHALKHLLAAFAVGALAWMVRGRRPLGVTPP